MILRDEIIPTSLEIKQEETFQLATDDFKSKWKSIFFDVKKMFGTVKIIEWKTAVAKIEIELDQEIKIKYPDALEQKTLEIMKNWFY